MRLEKLEIQGFKSFAKRAEMLFDGEITAIIGPNGSGKSNIADAVRWVLGEQSAKSLRGGKMEDIIFNGSDSAKASGFSEVALTLDNTDQYLPIDFDHVTVMRRVYRSGESEYLINQNRCRLKDVIQLFRDTGIGKEGYSIIGQGRVDEILSGRDEERRAVFEEAAGISKYKARKEEANRKRIRTHENLIRIEDILQELQAQLAPLEKQSADAKEYLRIYEETKHADLNLFLRRYDHAKDELTAMQNQMTQDQREQQDQAHHVGEVKQEYQEHEEKLNQIETQMEIGRQEYTQHTVAMEKMKSQFELLSQQVIHRQERNDVLEQDRQEAQKRMAALEQELSEKKEGTIRKDTLKNAYQNELQEWQRKIAGLASEIAEKERRIDEQKEAIMQEMNRVAASRMEKSRLQTLRQSMAERLDQLEGECGRIVNEYQQAQAEWKEEQITGETLEKEQAELERQQSEIQQKQQYAQTRMQEQQERIYAVQKEIDECSMKLRVLSDMKEEYEGYFASVRRLLRDARQDSTLQAGIIGVVAELIHVPQKLETAMETALGTALQNIVTENEEAAKRAIQHLRTNHYGRATFLPLSSIRAKHLQEAERATLTAAGCLGIASELIEFEVRYDGILNYLLGRTVVCEDMESAIALARVNRYAFRIVTLEGDMIAAGGSMSGGSTKQSNSQLLGRERQMEQWRVRVQERQQERKELQTDITAQEESLQTWQEKDACILQEIHALALAKERQMEKTNMLEKFVEQYGEQRQRLEEEQAALQENCDDIEKQLANAGEADQHLEEKQQLSQQDVVCEQEKLSAMRRRMEDWSESRHACQIKQAELEQEMHSQQEWQNRFEREKDELNQQLMRIEQETLRNADSVQTSQAEKERLLQDNEQRAEQLAIMEKQIGDMQEQREYQRAQVQSANERWRQANERMQTLMEHQHQHEFKKEKAELALDALHQQIWNEYELTYEGAQDFRDDAMDIQKLNEISRTGKQAMRAFGSINLQAIEDYHSVRTRFDEMDIQRNDLIQAQTDLETMIDELAKHMKTQFLEEFKKINQNFSETFRELFGGGNAELRLQDYGDVLQSGIEIIAQPPGKKLQLLSLLSGGERALTAIALLFSMLKLKPTPFCLLDEIEAALDEANVDRFAQYLKRYADKTQFVLITHRKGSMAVSDLLYGIAMEGRGVSKVVSVKLDDFREETSG